MSPILGIDLGTTNSAVAYMKNGRPAIIPNGWGEALTPSVVAFDGDSRPYVGRDAETRTVAAVRSIKRRMGSDEVVHVDSRAYTPVEISAIILGKLKADTEARLGESVQQAVVTVPAYFNDSQRRATREAATAAGLEVRRLVNEPTAAALAYGLDLELNIEKTHTILVWDLGGGTFDVSLLELGGDGVFEVKAVNGDTQLGGDDYDQRLAEMLMERFSQQWHVDVSGDPSAERLMHRLAEQAKIRLSTENRARVVLPHSFGHGSRCAVTITRDAFEQATADITERMTGPARQVLADAGLDPLGLDRVVLVGGMTRVPVVRRLVKQITGLEPYGHIDPDKVVALGAAIQAGVLAGQVRNVTLVDVTPLSLGIETQGGLFGRIIERNTPIPTSRSRLFTNARDNQTEMEIHVLQGERELATDNTSLGRFQLLGITPQPRGQARAEVTFDIDANGMVQIAAIDLHTEAAMKVRLDAATSLRPQAVERILAESQRQSASDRRRRKRIEAAIYAENLIRAAEQLLAEAGMAPAAEAVRELAEAAQKGIAAVQDALADEGLERIQKSTKALETLLRELSLELKRVSASGAACHQAA